MRAVIMFLFVAFGLLATVGALPSEPQRIVGGSVTTIDQYPNAVAMLVLWPWGSYYQNCGGAIITSRSILSAAHCYYNDRVDEWRARVGSTFANSGGTVHVLSQIIMHPNFVRATLDNDVAVLHVATPFTYGTLVQPASIAGAAYNVADNTEVWAVGWGRTSYYGSSSEQLRHVQVWTINQATCVSRYTELGRTVNDNMLCSGWLDVGGRDQCSGDSGGPLYHNNVIIGICSWGQECALARYPGVNTRVSRYTSWIQANA